MDLRHGARRLRRRAGGLFVDNFFRGMANAGRLLPMARPERHRVEVLRDLRYRDGEDRAHLLDVYRPIDPAPGPRPVLIYLHGGGFRILSKDTHWLMALAFARKGYLVFNVDYRLAPRHPFPAALEDACAAYAWVVANAAGFGGDPSRLVLAGESAGGNLVTSLAVATSYRREEAWTRPVWDCGVSPLAVVAACGILQVSDPGRFERRRSIGTLIADRIAEVHDAYLGSSDEAQRELADPLLVLEQALAPERPLPPFFAPVGTRDPLLDDTRRLDAALSRLGVPCEARYYQGEVHAFHAFVFRKNARRCWRDAYAFLDRHAPATVPSG